MLLKLLKVVCCWGWLEINSINVPSFNQQNGSFCHNRNYRHDFDKGNLREVIKTVRMHNEFIKSETQVLSSNDIFWFILQQDTWKCNVYRTYKS